MKQINLLITILMIAIISRCNTQNRLYSTEENLSRGIEKGKSIGASVAIYENGKTIYYSNGCANIREDKSINENTQFEIGSITKSFVALLIMISEEEGLLSINDPIEKYFPDSIKIPKGKNNDIKIKNLLTHNSGLPLYPTNIDAHTEAQDLLNYSEQNLIDFLQRYELTKEPGTAFNYSNVGYGILGYILEKVHNKSFNQLIKEKITNPLGMERTSLNVAEHPDNNYADGYFKGEIINRYRNENCVLNGYGGLRSSAKDLLIYMKAQAGIIVTPLYNAMRKTQEVQFDNNGESVCNGWFKVKDFINFAGSTKGFFSFVVLNTKTNKIFVMLTNSNNQKWVTGIAKEEMNF